VSVLLKRVWLSAVVILCASWGLTAQSMRTSDLGRTVNDKSAQALANVNDNPFAATGDLDENGNPKKDGEGKADSVRKRDLKPLESYFFSDSVRAQRYIMWNLDTYANNVKLKNIDTLLGDFSVDYPFMREDVGDANVGIFGGVSVPLNFFRRPTDNDFDFARAYYSYLFTPDNANFYNVKRPYTILAYQMCGQTRYSENNLHVIHAQNVTPTTGFNVSYDNHSTKGIYTWHRGQVRDLSIAVTHTGKRYSVHAGYIHNSIYQRENGGLVEDWHVTDTLYESSQGIPMRMTDALNEAKNNAVYVVQSYGVPLIALSDDDFTMGGKPAFYVGYAFLYNNWGKRYSDTYSGTTYNITDRKTGATLSTQNFYKNWYINASETSDTMYESAMTNRLFLQLQPYNRNGVLGTVDGGIGWDNRSYYQFDMNDYLYGGGIKKRHTVYFYADAKGFIKRYFDWHGALRYNFAGYRANDVALEGDARLRFFIKESPVELSGRFAFALESPSYWSENYFSNHFAWKNEFNKQNRTRLEATLRAPIIGAEVGFRQSVLGNTVYFDADALPAQSSAVVSVTGLYLREDIKLGGLHLNHRVLVQYSSDQTVAPVPTVAANISYYFQFQPVKNVLTLKIGIDGWYNTKYYAQGYNPATMQFYNQREVEIGNYPYFNAFVVAKWKRMRIMLQYQHANENLFGDYSPFSVPHYPYNRAILKYGISWNFDD